MSFQSLTLRCTTVLVGCLGLVWGILNVAPGMAADDFLDIETRLLRYEKFAPAASAKTLANPVVQDLSDCDNHAQRALLLMEMSLADASLRSGAVAEFDQHVGALRSRTLRALSCTPRDSFIWLVAFELDVEHGLLNEHSFDLLAMSYETSPNEAWIGIRRIAVATPVVLSAPEPVQQEILAEYQNLVRRRFLEIPARSYVNASAPVRAMLQSRIEQLDPPSQKALSDELQKLRR